MSATTTSCLLLAWPRHVKSLIKIQKQKILCKSSTGLTLSVADYKGMIHLIKNESFNSEAYFGTSRRKIHLQHEILVEPAVSSGKNPSETEYITVRCQKGLQKLIDLPQVTDTGNTLKLS